MIAVNRAARLGGLFDLVVVVHGLSSTCGCLGPVALHLALTLPAAVAGVADHAVDDRNEVSIQVHDQAPRWKRSGAEIDALLDPCVLPAKGLEIGAVDFLAAPIMNGFEAPALLIKGRFTTGA